MRNLNPRRIAMVSMHTSPTEPPGSADAGGMNVVEWHAALALAGLGYEVDLITRRSDPGQPDVAEIQPGVRLLYLDAGPVRPRPKSAIDAYIPQFADGLAELTREYDLYHCQHWMSGIAALDLAHRRGVPLVQSFHSVAACPGRDLSEGEPPESPARVPGEARLARSA
ncbi:MAG: glycosyltransferase, partial [Propionibacteriaceae bacterium]|nr:glycosyltransferase [Propionibacteriaceae bacterium]